MSKQQNTSQSGDPTITPELVQSAQSALLSARAQLEEAEALKASHEQRLRDIDVDRLSSNRLIAEHRNMHSSAQIQLHEAGIISTLAEGDPSQIARQQQYDELSAAAEAAEHNLIAFSKEKATEETEREAEEARLRVQLEQDATSIEQLSGSIATLTSVYNRLHAQMGDKRFSEEAAKLFALEEKEHQQAVELENTRQALEASRPAMMQALQPWPDVQAQALEAYGKIYQAYQSRRQVCEKRHRETSTGHLVRLRLAFLQELLKEHEQLLESIPPYSGLALLGLSNYDIDSRQIQSDITMLHYALARLEQAGVDGQIDWKEFLFTHRVGI